MPRRVRHVFLWTVSNFTKQFLFQLYRLIPSPIWTIPVYWRFSPTVRDNSGVPQNTIQKIYQSMPHRGTTCIQGRSDTRPHFDQIKTKFWNKSIDSFEFLSFFSACSSHPSFFFVAIRQLFLGAFFLLYDACIHFSFSLTNNKCLHEQVNKTFMRSPFKFGISSNGQWFSKLGKDLVT